MNVINVQTLIPRIKFLPQSLLLSPMAKMWIGCVWISVLTRDDWIVDSCYPILSCFWKMISVSDPNSVLVEIILSVSDNYPKVYIHFCAVSILPC